MRRLTDPKPRFTEDLYAPWCKTWLRLQDDLDGVSDWLVTTPKREIDRILTQSEGLPLAQLTTLATQIDQASPSTADLVTCWTWLRRLERLHQGDAASASRAPTTVLVDDKTHLLVPPPRLYPATTDNAERFARDTDMGKLRQIDLLYRWQALRPSKTLQCHWVPSLERRLLRGRLRVGMAPFVAVADLDWQLDADDTRGIKGGVPIQCRGGKDPASHAADLDTVLRAAWEAGVHILVLPELAVDEPLLRQCQAWLGKHNLRERRLRLVVAGSRHCAAGAGFANRCTVLGPLGDPLWEQDKHEYFAEWGAAVLAHLSPDRPIAEILEPTAAGSVIGLGTSDIGWLLAPICLDYAIDGSVFDGLGADLYLVPALTKGLALFAAKADRLGRRHYAASFVCNAQTEGDRRCLGYLPVKGKGPRPSQIRDLPLFIVDAEMVM